MEATSGIETGVAYAILGPLTGDISAGDAAVRWEADNVPGNLGHAIAAGDVDGDKVSDVILGAPDLDNEGLDTVSYVFFSDGLY